MQGLGIRAMHVKTPVTAVFIHFVTIVFAGSGFGDRAGYHQASARAIDGWLDLYPADPRCEDPCGRAPGIQGL